MLHVGILVIRYFFLSDYVVLFMYFDVLLFDDGFGKWGFVFLIDYVVLISKLKFLIKS